MSDAQARLAALRASHSGAKDSSAAVDVIEDPTKVWHKTACVLCSNNCGIEVRLDGRKITRVRGDKDHPASKGYTCEKALRIDYYQNGRDRLTSPLRRRPDGTFEEISWDTAIGEVAGKLAAIRARVGGDKILYYGGGGQGNHFPGRVRPRCDADAGCQVPLECARPGKDGHVLGTRQDVRQAEPRCDGRFRAH